MHEDGCYAFRLAAERGRGGDQGDTMAAVASLYSLGLWEQDPDIMEVLSNDDRSYHSHLLAATASTL